MESFFSSDFMPHGYCYAWHPGILWITVLSDLAIFLAYFSIPVALMMFVKRRRNLQFRGIFVLFAAFILLCGITHLVSILTIWHGTYGWHALTKFATATVSIMTASVIFTRMKDALAIPTPDEYRLAADAAVDERIKRHKLEHARQAEAIFKNTTQFVPTALLVVGTDQHIRLANSAAEALFKYDSDGLVGLALDELLPVDSTMRHGALVSQLFDEGYVPKAMADGRIVQGIDRQGELVNVLIKIAIEECGDERLAFANISHIDDDNIAQQEKNLNSERVQRVIDATNDGIWEWNTVSNAVWFSPRAKNLTGVEEGSEGGFEHWRKHIHPDDSNRVQDALIAHLERGERYDVVYRGRTSTGHYEWLHSRGNSIRDGNGRPLLMMGSLANVNELHQLRSSLDEKTEFLNNVLERSLAGLYIFDLKTQRNTYINPAYTRTLGWTLENLQAYQDKSGAVMDLYHPDDIPQIYAHFNDVKAQEHENGVDIEYRFKHAEGHWVWCYSKDSVLSRDSNGEPKEMLGTFFDLTAIKQREQAYRRLAIDFTSTFDQAAVGMAMLTLGGSFTKVNKTLCKILGHEEDELLIIGIEDIVFKADLPSTQAALASLASPTERQLRLRKRFIRKDGRICWVQTTIAQIARKDTVGSHLIAVLEDVTERVDIEKQLAASNASLERFAYSASHDLQEPLRKISSFADMLEDRLRDTLTDKEALFQLGRISDASRRMSSMIQSLLELSRYSRQKPVKTKHQLGPMMKRVCEDLTYKIKSSGAEIKVLDDAQLFVEQNSFEQVLRNLISNSIVHCPNDRHPLIEVSCETLPRFVQVTFRDNGYGVPQSQLEEIFEPFRRMAPNERPGAGMGLAICRQIMQSYQGEIHAKPSDAGAIFVLTLPEANDD